MESNKTVLITGGTDGIGFELAKLFAKDGYAIIVAARNEQELQTTAAELKTLGSKNVTTIACDLFETDAAKKLYDQVRASGTQIDVLVNNAGQGQYGLFAEQDLSRYMDIIQLNICSLVSLTHLFLQDFLQRGSGRILNLSSIASKAPGPWQAVYHGTKAFVQSFTEAVRNEVKDKGVSLTALLPGATDTDFFNKADMTGSKIVQDESNLADPAKVAKDGYDALMRGDDMVVSGLKNKLQVAMGAITPDAALAANMGKQQEPADPADNNK